MNDCPRIHSLVRGCNFEARYDETSEPAVKDAGVQQSAIFFGHDLPRKSTKNYVHDVCTVCGKTIERSKS